MAKKPTDGPDFLDLDWKQIEAMMERRRKKEEEERKKLVAKGGHIHKFGRRS